MKLKEKILENGVGYVSGIWIFFLPLGPIAMSAVLFVYYVFFYWGYERLFKKEKVVYCHYCKRRVTVGPTLCPKCAREDGIPEYEYMTGFGGKML